MNHDDLKYRRAEEQYFLEQNQVLLKRLHAEQAELAAKTEHQSQLGRCHACGDSMTDISVGARRYKACTSCEHTAMPSSVLRELLATGKGRSELAGVADAVAKRRLKTA